MDIVRRKIGSHEVEIEGDVMHVRFRGPYRPDDAREILTLSDQIFREHGTMFSLADLAYAQQPGPETRRVLATWPYLGEYVGIMYGASVAHRAVIRLVASAHRLLRPARTPTPLIEICATEADARQVVDRHRRLHSAPSRS